MADIEKVKQGLRCCADPMMKKCDRRTCPYRSVLECRMMVARDARSVIEQMEQEIERLKNAMVETGSIHCPCSPDCGDDCEKCVDSAIEETLKEERRWIPVSERLPDEYTNVLVMSKRFEEPKIDQMWIIGGEKMWTLDNVTHWMPLPQPPKEGDGE